MNTPVVLLLTTLCWGSVLLVEASSAVNRVSSDGVLYAAAPQERGAYAVGGGTGSYNYGYNTGDGIAKVEVRQRDGSIVGSYRYFDPTGKQVVRSYIADDNGFRVLGNDLPISPDTPASQVSGSPALTGAVEGTSDFNIPPPFSQDTTSQQIQLQEQQRVQQQAQLQQQQQQAQLQQQQQAQLQQQQQQQQQLQFQQQQTISSLEEQIYRMQEQLRALEERRKALLQTPVQKRRVTYRHLPNTLTGGYTAPYYYFRHQLNYDFPAGFAYTGLPVIEPASEPQKGSPYVIGRAR